jgi:hypothetical protein
MKKAQSFSIKVDTVAVYTGNQKAYVISHSPIAYNFYIIFADEYMANNNNIYDI